MDRRGEPDFEPRFHLQPWEGDTYDSVVELRVLGAVEVLRDGVSARLGGPKQRTVLALLATQIGRTLSTDSLIDSLWREEPPAGARHTLQTYISNLRAELGDVLVRDSVGYQLALERDQVDATRFEDEVAAAAEELADRPREAATRLREALALWRGLPYADQSGITVLDLEGRRLEELRVKAVEDRIEAELALGMHSYLVGELEALTVEYPLRERFRAQHMLALYRSGRQAEALRSYEKTRVHLGEELGIDPSPGLRDLEERILEQDPSLDLPAERRVEDLAFLFTDVEGAQALWEHHPEAAPAALARHDQILVDAIKAAEGHVFKETVTGVWAFFPDVVAAVEAAQQAQLTLSAADWEGLPPIKVRMAIDRGEVESRAGEFSGPPLIRCSLLVASGHGGQILLSADAHATLSGTASVGWQARALGDQRFRGLGQPQPVFQLLVDSLPTDFPALSVDRRPSSAEGDLGRNLRGYELRERVGSGDFGVVYRAYQPTVGREVAIKVVRPELMNQPAFVRLFEAEAQLVASLEHPHILTLYDYWRDPDGAYLVMRWMPAGTLRRALDRGPWNLEPAIRLLSQIGAGLSFAHRRGVVHRDLKPSNVLLDDDGNGYLSDFGIAQRLVDAASVSVRPQTSSPAYLVPEELRGEPLRITSDIYALGLLTFEILSGRRPPMDGAIPSISESRPEIPIGVDEVVIRATQDDPSLRFPSVDEFLAALISSVGAPSSAADVAFTATRNPYKGLTAFGERDAADFFGRENVVAELVRAVREHRMVSVVGPSGIGKSSLVRAGLIPALRAGAISGSQTWLITEFFPGSYPFEELESALMRVAIERPSDHMEDLRRDERGLLRVTKRMLPQEGHLLMVIDQFEELFTLTADEETRRQIMAALAEMVSDQRSRVRVVLTLRADFFDRPLLYPGFGKLVREGMVAVTSPDEEQLTSAVHRPAEGVGVRFEPGLVARILADVEEQPGGLPLLQYALTELFATRTSDLLTVPGYVSTGGVLGALGRRAEDLYLELDATGRDSARQVFLRLVAVHEAAEDTRRRVQKSELRSLGIDLGVLDGILGVFGNYRLLTFDRDPHTRGPTVEVAHEALLTEWGRLKEWIGERREDLLLHRRLAEAVEEWELSSQSPEFLLQRGRLHQFEAWAAATDLLLTDAEHEFLAASRFEEDRNGSRSARRRWAIVGVLAVAVVLITVLALGARNRARVATARELAAASVSVLDTDAQRGILLALEAIEATPVPEREAVEALHQSLHANRLLAAAGWPEDRVAATQMAVAASPDGDRFAVSADGAVIDVWDVASRTLVATMGETAGEADLIAWPMIDWHGNRLAGLGPDGVLRVWDSDSGEEVGQVEADSTGPGTTEYSPDGSLIATVHQVGSPVEPKPTALRVWDAETLEMVWEQPYDGVISVAFDPRGAFIALARFAIDATSGLVEVREVATGELIYSFETDSWATAVTVSPNSDLVVGHWNGLATVHDGATGDQIGELGPAADPNAVVAHSPVGSLVALNDEIWDMETGSLVRLLEVDAARIRFTDDGSRILTGGVDLVGRVWALTDPGPGELFTFSPAPVVQAVDLSADGSLLAVLALPERYPSVGTVEVRSWESQELFATIPDRTGQDVALSPNGSIVAAFGEDGLGLWRADGDALVPNLEESIGLIGREGGSGVSFSPDGTVVAATGSTGMAGVWEATTGRPVGKPWRVSQSQAFTVAFSPDGSLIATTDNDRGVRVWRVSDLTEVTSFVLDGFTSDVFFSQGGRTVIVLSQEGVAILDLETGDGIDLAAGESTYGDLSPNENLLAIGTDDGVDLWDLEARQLVSSLRGHPGDVTGVEFHPNGMHLVTGGGDSVRGWTLDTDELVAIARSRAARSLTDTECQTYLHIDACPAR